MTTHKVLPSGAHYMRIPHNADPSKDEVWLERVRVEMLDTPDLYERHILMNDQVLSGHPVHTSYVDKFHCPERYHETGIPLVPGSLYFGGWDAGQALTPAFTLWQMLPESCQIHGILEVTSPGAESMRIFAPKVWRLVEQRIPGHFMNVLHYADETVRTRSGTDGRSARSEAKKHGFEGNLRLRPVPNAFFPRRSALDWLLARRLGAIIDGEEAEVPGLMIDGRYCPMLRQALQGRYQWKINKPEDGPAGQVHMEPAKNLWSHVAESAQYVARKVRSLIEPGEGIFSEHDEEDELVRHFKDLKRRARPVRR